MSNIALPSLNIKGLTKIRTLGKGSFGEVIEVEMEGYKETVAIKQIPKTKKNRVKLLHTREISALKLLKDGPNIVKMLDVIETPYSTVIVLEKMDCSLLDSIKKSIRENKYFEEKKIVSLARQLLNGLNYIHSNNLTHRDLKPENILFKNGKVCISDFGLVRDDAEMSNLTEYISTRWYRAPELILKSKSYNKMVDMWSLACVICETFLLKPLLPGDTELDQLSKTISLFGSPYLTLIEEEMACGLHRSEGSLENVAYDIYGGGMWADGVSLAQRLGIRIPNNILPKRLNDQVPSASPECIDFLSKLFKYDSERRLSAANALSHPWILGKRSALKIDTDFFATCTTNKFIFPSSEGQRISDVSSPATIFVPDIDSISSSPSLRKTDNQYGGVTVYGNYPYNSPNNIDKGYSPSITHDSEKSNEQTPIITSMDPKGNDYRFSYIQSPLLAQNINFSRPPIHSESPNIDSTDINSLLLSEKKLNNGLGFVNTTLPRNFISMPQDNFDIPSNDNIKTLNISKEKRSFEDFDETFEYPSHAVIEAEYLTHSIHMSTFGRPANSKLDDDLNRGVFNNTNSLHRDSWFKKKPSTNRFLEC